MIKIEVLKKQNLESLVRKKIVKHKQFLLYAIIGVVGATIDFIIFAVLYNKFGMDKFQARAISITCGITNGFLCNTFFNFKTKDKIFLRFISFYSIGIFGLGIAYAIYIIFVDGLKFDTNFITIASIPVLVIVQYTLNKAISFRKNHEKENILPSREK